MNEPRRKWRISIAGAIFVTLESCVGFALIRAAHVTGEEFLSDAGIMTIISGLNGFIFLLRGNPLRKIAIWSAVIFGALWLLYGTAIIMKWLILKP